MSLSTLSQRSTAIVAQTDVSEKKSVTYSTEKKFEAALHKFTTALIT